MSFDDFSTEGAGGRALAVWRQLSTLSMDNFGDAPRWLKVLVCTLAMVFILAFAWLLLIKPAISRHGTLVTQETTLISQYAQKYAKAQQLTAIQTQTQALNGDLAMVLERLPARFNMSLVVEQLHAIAASAGVTLVDVKVQPENLASLFVERGIVIVAEGSYHQLGRMLAQMSSLSVLLTVHDFSMEKINQNAGASKLRLTLHAKTYRAKDEPSMDAKDK